MPRNWRRSRWRRALGRGVPRLLAPAGVVAVVVALLAGGASQIGRGSASYRRTVDRGYAALASVVARRSQTTGAALGTLLGDAPSLPRLALFAELGSLAAQAKREDAAAAAMTPPAPAVAGAHGCRIAMDERASGTAAVRAALQGALGGDTGTSVVDPGAASSQLAAAVSQLAQADASWSSCRGAMRRAPGTPDLPASRWVSGVGPWGARSIGGLVGAVVRSPTLAAHHALALTAVSTVPSALAAGANVVLPPTSQLTVHGIVTNRGNVDEPAVAVTVALVPATSGPPPLPLTAITAVGAQHSVTVVLGPFPVQPGATYRIEINAAPPQGEGGASNSLPVQVAAVPPTTTTTTTTPPRHSRKALGSSRVTRTSASP